MHELSIALAIVELAEISARELGGATVEVVRVRVGPLSGVVPGALQFSFDLAAQGTPIEGARLDIESEPVVVWCPACLCPRPIEDVQHRRCPECGSLASKLVSGDSLELVALEVTDHAAANR